MFFDLYIIEPELTAKETIEDAKNLNTLEDAKNLAQKQAKTEILVYKITHCSNKCIKNTVCNIKKNVSVDYSTMNEDNDIILMKDIHGYFQDIVLENLRELMKLNSNDKKCIKYDNYILENKSFCKHIICKFSKLKTILINRIKFISFLHQNNNKDCNIENDIIKKILKSLKNYDNELNENKEYLVLMSCQ